jgi:hypothetical protein
MHYPVCEVIQEHESKDSESLYVRFFKPTKYLWWARAKLALFKLWCVTSKQVVVTRIVDADRAAYLLVSYSEWRARLNLSRSYNESLIEEASVSPATDAR